MITFLALRIYDLTLYYMAEAGVAWRFGVLLYIIKIGANPTCRSLFPTGYLSSIHTLARIIKALQ